MTYAELIEAIRKLGVPERIELANAIWDSVLAETHEIPMTESQRRELLRRLSARERSQEGNSSWDALKQRLQGGQDG